MEAAKTGRQEKEDNVLLKTMAVSQLNMYIKIDDYNCVLLYNDLHKDHYLRL